MVVYYPVVLDQASTGRISSRTAVHRLHVQVLYVPQQGYSRAQWHRARGARLGHHGCSRAQRSSGSRRRVGISEAVYRGRAAALAIQGYIYLSVVGGVTVSLCRVLVPPELTWDDAGSRKGLGMQRPVQRCILPSRRTDLALHLGDGSCLPCHCAADVGFAVEKGLGP